MLYLFKISVEDLTVLEPTWAIAEPNFCVKITFLDHMKLLICPNEFNNSAVCKDIGKSCLFAMEHEVSEQDQIRIDVFSNDQAENSGDIIVGSCSHPAIDIFNKLQSSDQNSSVLPSTSGDHISSKNASHSKKTELNRRLSNLSKLADSLTSYAIKGLYPLVNEAGTLVGSISLKIQLSCYGQSVITKFGVKTEDGVAIHDTGIGNEEILSWDKKVKSKSACVSEMLLSSPRKNQQNQPNENNEEIQQVQPEDQNQMKLCTPPSSNTALNLIKPAQEYDEYIADMNGNTLVIRVPKKSGMKTSVLDSDMPSSRTCLGAGRHLVEKQPNHTSRVPDRLPCPFSMCEDEEFHHNQLTESQIRKNLGGTFENRCGLPAIKANLKYQGFMHSDQPLNMPAVQNASIEKYRLASTDIRRQRDAGVSRGCSAGVQISKLSENTDPLSDVFVLKIGKQKSGDHNQNGLELELRTPRDPFAEGRTLKSNTGSQANEDDIDANCGGANKKKANNGDTEKKAAKKKGKAKTNKSKK